MQTEQPIEIGFSKAKLSFFLLISIGVVAFGIWMLSTEQFIHNPYFKDPLKAKIAVYASIIFFGFGIYKFSQKLFDNKPKLIIDNKGITINTKAAYANYIPWSDVEKAVITSLRRQSFIIVHVKNPEEYINNQQNVLKRKAMQLDYKVFGSPLTISAAGLTISSNKLLRMINKKIGTVN